MAYINRMNCCGVGELTVHNSSIGAIKLALDNAKMARMGIVIGTTIGVQRTAAARLKACGFKEIKKFKNPNSGNNVKVWIKEL